MSIPEVNVEIAVPSYLLFQNMTIICFPLSPIGSTTKVTAKTCGKPNGK